jgi:hypothetical protein
VGGTNLKKGGKGVGGLIWDNDKRQTKQQKWNKRMKEWKQGQIKRIKGRMHIYNNDI